MGAEQSFLEVEGTAAAAEARKRHQFYLGAFQLLHIDRQALGPGTQVQILKGTNAGLTGEIRAGGYSEERGAWEVDVEHEDGSVEDWFLARESFKVVDAEVEAAAQHAAERMLWHGLQTQFDAAPRVRAQEMTWPGMFSFPTLPESFCPYPDGNNLSRRCHRHGVAGTGYFQMLPTLDRDVPTNEFFRPGKTLPVMVRHSNMVQPDDAGMDIRGMAIRFADPGQTSPLDLLLTTGAGSPWWSATTMGQFAQAHMGGARPMQQFMEGKPHSFSAYTRALKRAPVSYAALHYYSHVCYELAGEAAEDGDPAAAPRHHARFRVVPAGEFTATHDGTAVEDEPLPEKDAMGPWHAGRLRPHPSQPGVDEDGNAVRAKDYLRQEFKDRMKVQPVIYWLDMQVFPADRVDDIRDQMHLNPTQFPLDPVYACDQPGAARPVMTTARWVRLGELIVHEPVDDTVSDRTLFSVANRPACLRPVPSAGADDYASTLRLREMQFPGVPDAPPPRPHDGPYGGLVKYNVTFFVGDSQPRGPFPDEAQVHVQFLGKKFLDGDESTQGLAVETRPMRLSHWATNAFRVETGRGPEQRQPLGFDDWNVCCSDEIRDISVLKITLKPVGHYTKWFLKRVDVRQERPPNVDWQENDEAMLHDVATMRRAFNKHGIEWRDALQKRARQVCTVVGTRTENTPKSGDIEAVVVKFRDSKKPVIYPKEALEPYSAPLSFPAYQWLEEGETFLFEATPMLAGIEEDKQALALRQTLLAQRKAMYLWDTPTGGLDVPWDLPHRLPIGLRPGIVQMPAARGDADADGGASMVGEPLSPTRSAQRRATRAAKDHALTELLRREAKDLLLRRTLETPSEDRLQVVSPNGQQHVRGVYVATGDSADGLPVWELNVGGHNALWLRSWRGHWVVTETPPRSADPPSPAIMSAAPHQGAMPGAITQRQQRSLGGSAWQRAEGSGRWAKDPAITVTWDARWWAEGEAPAPDEVWQQMCAELFAHGPQRDSEPLPLRAVPTPPPPGGWDPRAPPPPPAGPAWLTDDEFARPFTAGALCMALEQLEPWSRDLASRSVDFNFQDSDVAPLVPQRIAARFGGRPTLNALSREHIVLVADFSAMEGLPTQPGKYTCAPIILFLVQDWGMEDPAPPGGEAPLLPLGIQLGSRGGDTRVWTPRNCSSEDWLTVKCCAMSAAAHVQFFGHRILYCHLVAEPFIVAAQRHLPDMHPLYKLLHPHMKRSLAAITQAKEMMSRDSPLLRIFALTTEGVRALQERLFMRWHLDTWGNYQNNITQRGMEHVRPFAYRDQVCDLWDVLQGYVQEALVALYACCYNEEPDNPSPETRQLLRDDVCADDPEAAAWLSELAKALRRPSWRQLFSYPQERPRDPGLQDLADLCTCFVWTVTVQHTAMAHSMWDTFGWPASAPLALYAEPPLAPVSLTARDREQEALRCLFAHLPDRVQCAGQVVLVWFLSRGGQMVDLDAARHSCDALEHPTEQGDSALPLGWWNEDVFILAELRRLVRQLQQSLDETGHRLPEVRPPGAGARHPAVFPVDPRMVPNSLLPLSRRVHPSEDRLPGAGRPNARRT